MSCAEFFQLRVPRGEWILCSVLFPVVEERLDLGMGSGVAGEEGLDAGTRIHHLLEQTGREISAQHATGPLLPCRTHVRR